jgi:hypothetical protein
MAPRKKDGKEFVRPLVESLRKDQERKVDAIALYVVLLGAGGDGLEERRALARKLGQTGIVAFIPEDDLSPDVAPSLAERDMLANGDIDLAFVNVQSWGSAAEFAEFQSDPKIAPKLRILVERRYHPLYGSPGSSGYLTDSYLTHDAVFGHVYMYKGEDSPEWIPSTDEVVLKIADRYKQWRAFRSK